MCRDLRVLSDAEVREGLREAYRQWQKTGSGSEAERFAMAAVKCWSDELTRRVQQAKQAPKGRVYLSGPMRGIPEFNFPAFKRKTEELRAAGWEVFSPAEADIVANGRDFSPEHPEGKETNEPGLTARECLARDCAYICGTATHMYMMKGWEKSTGAQAEWALARAIHLPVMYEGDAK
jgi:hypothetical protein